MKKAKYLILTFLMMFIAGRNVYAGELSIWASASNVQVGSTVTISVKAGSLFGTFNLTSSDNSILSGSTSGDLDDDTGTYTFTAKKEGTVTITVSPIDMSDYDTEEYYRTSKSVTLNVVSKTSSSGSTGTTAEKKEYSSDNTLKSLSVDSYELEPAFDKETTEYKLTVDESVEKININATPNDAKASISGTGEVNLSNGENTFEIKVTAENGNEKIYKLIVTVIDQNPIEVSIGKVKFTVVKKNNNLIDKLEYYEEITIQINDQDVVAYENTKTKVTLVLLKDKDNKIEYYIYDKQKNTYTLYKSIKVGEVTLQLINTPDTLPHFKKYTLKLQDQEITYYKIKESHKVGLIYGTNIKTGNTGYYVYDQNEETLSKYYDEEVKVYQKELTEIKNYMMIFLGVVAFISIIIIITSLKKGKKHQKRIHK